MCILRMQRNTFCPRTNRKKNGRRTSQKWEGKSSHSCLTQQLQMNHQATTSFNLSQFPDSFNLSWFPDLHRVQQKWIPQQHTGNSNSTSRITVDRWISLPLLRRGEKKVCTVLTLTHHVRRNLCTEALLLGGWRRWRKLQGHPSLPVQPNLSLQPAFNAVTSAALLRMEEQIIQLLPYRTIFLI